MITSFTLNGQPVTARASANERLLDVLRGEFGLTGPKCGCKEGECGACAVILDGKLVNSCLVALGAIEGCSVTTIEGFAGTPRFDVLNRCFAEAGAVQCGYCTPGMILAGECLLARDPNPTERAVRDGLSGNLCRCTGYEAIVRAVLAAAKEGSGLW